MNKNFPLSPLRLAVLISGSGTTLRNLLQKIDTGALDARVATVISSSATARGLQFAEQALAPRHVILPSDFDSVEAYSQSVFDICRDASADVVAMAGFLKLVRIPADFENRVMNIHPALIPAFCGQGYYGRRVHQAALANGVKLSGCTVHFVDNQYDHGPIVLQQSVPVLDGDTPESLAARVFQAECEAYPRALRWFAQGRLHVSGRHVVVEETPEDQVIQGQSTP